MVDYSRTATINGAVYNFVPLGYCACGCGRKTTVPRWCDKTRGNVGGRPQKFIKFHNLRGKSSFERSTGYTYVLHPDHPKAGSDGYVIRSVLVAEKALGKYLPKSAIVHHVDGIDNNDSNSNLVVCEDHAYHMLIEKRTRAYRACGHANWLKCPYCKEYDSSDNMFVRLVHGTISSYHRSCAAAYARNRSGRIKIWLSE